MDQLPAAEIKQECGRALAVLRLRGNNTADVAFRIINECIARCPLAPLPYRLRALIFFETPTANHRHLEHALGDARRATELSPDSIEFARFHEELMFRKAVAAEGEGLLEEVVRECEKALRIENPVDPAEEWLPGDDKSVRVRTAAERVGQLRDDLRSLIQKSNIVMMANWGKIHDQDFKLIPN